MGIFGTQGSTGVPCPLWRTASLAAAARGLLLERAHAHDIFDGELFEGHLDVHAAARAGEAHRDRDKLAGQRRRLRRRDEAALATVCRERAPPRGAARGKREHELLGVARARLEYSALRLPRLEVEHGGAQRAGAVERREADDVGEKRHARDVSLRSAVAREERHIEFRRQSRFWATLPAEEARARARRAPDLDDDGRRRDTLDRAGVAVRRHRDVRACGRHTQAIRGEEEEAEATPAASTDAVAAQHQEK